MSSLRAAVCREFGRPLAVEALELRAPGPAEVEVRVAACAICHSDLTFLTGAWGGELPAVYGHEVAGVVEAVGPGVVGIAQGDHAVVTLVRFCGRCAHCLRGEPTLCERRAELPPHDALTTPDGGPVTQGLRTAGFAERVLVHESQVIPVPEEIPLESAALVGCGVVTGVGAVLNTARLEAGSTLAVVGTGGVGLNAIQGGVLAGARTIVAIDVRGDKVAAARRFGATDGIDASREDVAGAVRELTGGRGVDAVVVTAGSAPAAEQALGLVDDGGAVVLVGMPTGALATIDPETIADRSLRILGSKVGSVRPGADVPALVALYREGRLELDGLISARFPLEDAAEAMETAAAGSALRVVLVP